MPMIERINVVLPAPFRPLRPTNFPLGTSIVTPRRMLTDAIETSSPLTCSMMASGFCARYFSGNVFSHFDIGQDRGRQAVGDDAALIEGEHALGIAIDDFHVVLDEQHGYLLCTHGFHHHIHQCKFLLG